MNSAKEAAAMSRIEYKAGPLVIEGIEDRVVKQIFAVMGNVDDGFDRIWPKAFRKTISERMDRIRVLWQHYAGEPPIGKALLLKELKKDELPESLKAKSPEATGALYGEVMYLDTPRGNEILAGIRAGAITENSIGYDVVTADFEGAPDGKGQVRNLREIRLWDISPVNYGMNSSTMNMKSIASPAAVRALSEIEAWLEHATLPEPRTAEIVASVNQLKGLLSAEPPVANPALTVMALMQRIRLYEMEA